MALVLKDRVLETSNSTGTGNFTLAGPVTGFQSFAAIGNGNTCYYTITDTVNWEVGIGTYTSAGTLLSRDTILDSSNGGSIVDFPAGNKNVFVTYPAGKSIYTDANDNSVNISKITTNSASAALTITQTGTGNALVVEDSTNPDATPFVIDNAGNVGIGTSSPSAKLQVASTNNIISSTGTGGYGAFYAQGSSTNQAFIFLGNGSGENGRITSENGGALYFSNGNGSVTERMRIDSSGNVGIGTNSPPNVANYKFVSTYAPTGAIYQAFGGSFTDARLFAENAYGGAGMFSNHPFLFYTNSLERMRIHASGGVSIGNTTDSGAASLNVSGAISGGYIAHAAGTTAMGFGIENVVRVTPNASATYTTTVPAAGAICVLSILTSGTSSYTITFGTGFKATGTLATGTVSARYFNITFVSDGTNLIEMARTVAIA